ncbi:MAG TPA: hypothetical protein VL588_12550 [Bdellovibrionota bacterium]|jgi:hypothetical protein|nr:hypothetical protein [Bdellovibrionota bacterium]
MGQNIAFHLVARARPGRTPFANDEIARQVWTALRKTFPESAACALMPNHLHLITRGNPNSLPRKLAALLIPVKKGLGVVDLWDPVPQPIGIPDRHHLLRQIRYVHLNPCRAKLARDPLEWEWSTHRDWVGAVLDPWPDIAYWSKALGWSAIGVGDRLHRYTSADSAVQVVGTAPPQRAKTEGRSSADWGLSQIGEVVSIAARAPRSPQLLKGAHRSLCIRAARLLTRYSDAELARWAKVNRSSLSRLTQGLSEHEASVLRLILSDQRLRFHP